MNDKQKDHCLELLESLQESIIDDAENVPAKWMALLKIDEIRAFIHNEKD